MNELENEPMNTFLFWNDHFEYEWRKNNMEIFQGEWDAPMLQELRKLDLIVADAFGFEIKTFSSFIDGFPIGLPHFSSKYEDWLKIEHKISSLGLQRLFIDKLQFHYVTYQQIEMGHPIAWTLMRTTFEQRCRAAVRAIIEMNEEIQKHSMANEMIQGEEDEST